MRFSFLLSLLLCCLLQSTWSCQEKKTAAIPPTTVTETTTPSYPALGNDVLNRLYADVEQVDIIFYDLPISVNQEDAPSAKNTALYISPASPVITKTCKPIARLSFISKGSILHDADVYYDTGCHYFLFMKNNMPVAANAMAQGGIDFFNNIISQVSKPQQ